MGKIIDVEFRREREERPKLLREAAEDRFLIEEGLDLLHDFRSIRDPQMRQTFATLVRDIAAITTNIATRRPKGS